MIKHTGKMWNYGTKLILFVANLSSMQFKAINTDPSCIASVS